MCDYGEYEGDVMHDMWVDYTYHEYTGELGDWYGGDDACQYDVDENRPYGGDGYRQERREKSNSELIEECRGRIAKYERNIVRLRADIEQARQALENPKLAPDRVRELQHCVALKIKRVAECERVIEKENAKLLPLLTFQKELRKRRTIAICIGAVTVAAVLLWLICR